MMARQVACLVALISVASTWQQVAVGYDGSEKFVRPNDNLSRGILGKVSRFPPYENRWEQTKVEGTDNEPDGFSKHFHWTNKENSAENLLLDNDNDKYEPMKKFGKRRMEFLGKRPMEFLGKRQSMDFLDKRTMEMLRRRQMEYLRRRVLENIRNRRMEFIGKRGMEFLGKRPMEFLGKRDQFLEKRPMEFLGKRSMEFLGKRPMEFLGKRDQFLEKRPMEFLGKRDQFLEKRPMEFLGKRGMEFLGKRGMEFLGKRPMEFLGKRGMEFLGKRGMEFLGKRGMEFLGKRGMEFLGKRGMEFLGKRPMEFLGKRGMEFLGKRPMEFLGKRGMEFLGKRSVDLRKKESTNSINGIVKHERSGENGISIPEEPSPVVDNAGSSGWFSEKDENILVKRSLRDDGRSDQAEAEKTGSGAKTKPARSSKRLAVNKASRKKKKPESEKQLTHFIGKRSIRSAYIRDHTTNIFLNKSPKIVHKRSVRLEKLKPDVNKMPTWKQGRTNSFEDPGLLLPNVSQKYLESARDSSDPSWDSKISAFPEKPAPSGRKKRQVNDYSKRPNSSNYLDLLFSEIKKNEKQKSPSSTFLIGKPEDRQGLAPSETSDYDDGLGFNIEEELPNARGIPGFSGNGRWTPLIAGIVQPYVPPEDNDQISEDSGVGTNQLPTGAWIRRFLSNALADTIRMHQNRPAEFLGKRDPPQESDDNLAGILPSLPLGEGGGPRRKKQRSPLFIGKRGTMSDDDDDDDVINDLVSPFAKESGQRANPFRKHLLKDLILNYRQPPAWSFRDIAHTNGHVE